MADKPHCDRYWFLTLTTYGTWLPGDERGFVSDIRRDDDTKVIHNVPGTPIDADVPRLREYAERCLQGPPIYLTHEQAIANHDQFHETAAHRKWLIIADAVMRNHAHVVVGVPGDPDPETILRDFKAYASRKLNLGWSRPESDTWWTESGSKQKLKDDAAILGATRYVRDQEFPLVVWVHPDFAGELGTNPRESRR
jgi:REP element-mobilizing transposase RayT